jgi:hypothetical protein
MWRCVVAAVHGPVYNQMDESLPSARKLLSLDDLARLVSTLAFFRITVSWKQDVGAVFVGEKRR